ncbi:pyruvate kinase alpha/beta domain-containing protein [Aromatoleum anaerobium]|uniref:pyruvate kinase alpha/beta domain-containing protein n=1 Tax=Aromatoleum anaerobium TaxID=182180 RepID=UPI001FF58882|nr:pyruvate kinase alpha/beta domain-containing protein [Aromatoleum anaerobium]MCK0506379.1 hypothetical protein [Aromatoleum anaerobium]
MTTRQRCRRWRRWPTSKCGAGVHPVPFENAQGVTGMVEHACTAVVIHGFAEPGDDIVVVAGLPFGLSGSTNLLHIAHIS